ncbi:MAG: transcriptional regulator [Flavobacteriales bacterium]|nr:transcriptional regulator [Flavobacteriales bacterium]
MDLEERFRYIMKLNQLSASAFADEIGVQRSSISHILSGRNKPSLEFIQKVLKRFPKVDANWLINGTTSVDKSEIGNQKSEIEETSPSPYIESENENSSTVVEESSIQTNKGKIKKIVVFYDDQTFEEFNP